MPVKLEDQNYLLNNGLSSKEIKEAWHGYAFKFNFITEDFEKYRKENKLKENPLKVENHPIIAALNDEKKIDDQSNILLDFINTEFSICILVRVRLQNYCLEELLDKRCLFLSTE